MGWFAGGGSIQSRMFLRMAGPRTARAPIFGIGSMGSAGAVYEAFETDFFRIFYQGLLTGQKRKVSVH